jgi:hypothetical protein
MSGQRAQQIGHLIQAEPSRLGRVHRRHEGGVEDVGIEMDPESLDVRLRHALEGAHGRYRSARAP